MGLDASFDSHSAPINTLLRTVAVVSQKGGVGKTTVSLNLAYAFAKAGHRVVLVDADPQGAIGHSLRDTKESSGLAGFISGEGNPRGALLQTRVSGFGILPIGDVPPYEVQDFYARLADGTVFATLLDEFKGLADVVFIDTPSGFNGVTLGALRTVSHAISPLQAEPIALKTLPQLLSVIGHLRQEGASVELAALVLCMLQQRNADSLSVAEEAWSRLPEKLVAETTIPRDPKVLSANSEGVPLALMNPHRPLPVSMVFDQLAAELARKIGLEGSVADDPISLFA